MEFYKGFSIQLNSINHRWQVCCGYSWLADYATLGAAKSAITQKWAKELNDTPETFNRYGQ